MKQKLTLMGAMAMIFLQNNRDLAAATGWKYNTITSQKYRFHRGKLSHKKQEELVLDFGFKKVGEFRYQFPHNSVKRTIDNKLNKN